ncbi:MAG TPA: NYN domain-containing protein [Candidatus Desulfaltia sp.]|nr:NYN domain-containing protein [Candidatus Desulfaltia sp.]
MAYLIDGNNLLGHLFPGEIRNPGSRYALVSKLLAFQRWKRSRIHLVFDGPADDRLLEISRRRQKLLILFPPPGQRADEIIKDRIAGQTDIRHFFVVTSDRELAAVAKASGIKTLRVQEFAAHLKKVLREHRAEAELQRKPPAHPLSALELGLWLDAFGEKND